MCDHTSWWQLATEPKRDSNREKILARSNHPTTTSKTYWRQDDVFGYELQLLPSEVLAVFQRLNCKLQRKRPCCPFAEVIKSNFETCCGLSEGYPETNYATLHKERHRQCQNGSTNLFTPYRAQPRSTRIVVACPQPALSAAKRTVHASISFDQQVHVFLEASCHAKIYEQCNMVYGGGELEPGKPAREKASSNPKPCAFLKNGPRIFCPFAVLCSLSQKENRPLARDLLSPRKPPGSRRAQGFRQSSSRPTPCESLKNASRILPVRRSLLALAGRKQIPASDKLSPQKPPGSPRAHGFNTPNQKPLQNRIYCAPSRSVHH